jgi:hypothetical protein
MDTDLLNKLADQTQQVIDTANQIHELLNTDEGKARLLHSLMKNIDNRKMD